jgi:hypothetical protein
MNFPEETIGTAASNGGDASFDVRPPPNPLFSYFTLVEPVGNKKRK